MVIISNLSIGGVIIPYRKADNTAKIRHYGFKGHKSCYYSMISDNGQKLLNVVSVLIYMSQTMITCSTCHKHILVM